jgi:hypothetical protein
MDAVWGQAACSALPGLPAGVLIVSPDRADLDDGLAELVERLNRVGVEQFVAPRRQAEAIARRLSQAEAGPGLVLPAEEWLGDVLPARVHTAVLLPETDALATQVLASVRRRSEAWPETTWLVACRPSRQFAGRRLDQTLSASAPIPESVLDTLLRPSPEIT